MSNQLVSTIKDRITLEVSLSVKPAWREGWIQDQKPEIDKAVENEVKKRIEERKVEIKRLQTQLSSESQKLTRLKAELVSAKLRHPVGEDYDIRRAKSDVGDSENNVDQLESSIKRLQDTKDNRDNIREETVRNFEKKFNDFLWDGLSAPFHQQVTDQLKEFKPEKMLASLLAKHPWLKAWLDRGAEAIPSGLVYDFLYNHLSNSLIKCLESPKHSGDWGSLSPEDLNKKNLGMNWKAMDAVQLAKDIEGWTLSNIRKYYVADPCDESPNFDMYYEFKQVVNHRLTRVDMFRFLTRNHPISTTAITLKDGIQSTKSAPLQIDELAGLSKDQWDYFETVLVNVGEESAPTWILLQKVKGKWSAFAPDKKTGLSEKAAEWEEKLRKAVPNYDSMQFVDYSTNLSLNDIKNLEPVNAWHAVLLMKVYPCCKDGNIPQLGQYRQHVPLSLMLNLALEQCALSDTEERVRRGFANRSPFSNQSIRDEMTTMGENIKKENYLFGDGKLVPDYIKAYRLMMNFTDQMFTISDDHKTLTVKGPIQTESLLVEAYDVAYHNPLERLAYSPIQSEGASRVLFQAMIKHDIHIRSIKPILGNQSLRDQAKSYAYPMQCAARNRLLHDTNPRFIENAEISITTRQQIWQTTGVSLIKFFQEAGKAIDLDYMEQVRAFNKAWHESHCDHEKRERLPASQWAFVQIAQMGIPGIQSLFEQLTNRFASQWRAIDREPAPRLYATFDLSGSLTDKPKDYLQFLTMQISLFSSECTPLFRSIGFALPSPVDEEYLDWLIELIKILDQRQKVNPEDSPEIILYNLDNSSELSEKFIEKLQVLADQENLRCVIRLPDWDRAANENEKSRTLKARYRELQNKTLDNQRAVNHQKLEEDTQHIVECAKGTLKPDVILSNHLDQKVQVWEGEDVTYPLQTRTPGVQQQLQQQVQQEFQQEQQLEQEVEQEQEQQIAQYAGDEDKLVTRRNIDEKCRHVWDTVPDSKRAFSGYEGKGLTQLFSLWVGSEQDADQVIADIEPEAIRKIMEHPSQFRLGLSRDNLPAGFYLAHSARNHRLILCFSDQRERQDLRKRAAKTLKERNPFTVQLTAPRPATPFRGDFRQFGSMVTGQNATKIAANHWKFLALEPNDPKQTQNAVSVLRSQFSLDEVSPLDATVMMQTVDALGQVTKPGQIADGLRLLKGWAQKNNASAELQSALFDPSSALAMNAENLKSFGQLFDHYDVVEPGKQSRGTEMWLFLADQMLTSFGKKHFSVWKSRVLDSSKNWSECLEKSEVDAMALSIVTLKDKPDHQALWWKLVDAHGQSTGPMRYSQLWYSFQKIIEFTEEHHLNFDLDALTRYLEKTPNFNATVFLDRLHTVLKIAHKQLDHNKIQQDILDRIDQIDWRHNGYYYAARYESYPYPHPELQLSGFTRTSNDPRVTYRASWDGTGRGGVFEINSLVTHALRYASQSMQISMTDFTKFESLIQKGFGGVNDSPNLCRLLTACFAVGIDQIDSVDLAQIETAKKALDLPFLRWINQLLPLDKETISGSLQMHWQDLPQFAEALSELGLRQGAMELEPREALKFINACGRALQCYRALGQADSKEQLKKLLNWATKRGSDQNPSMLTTRTHSLDCQNLEFTTLPWLVDNAISEKQSAFKQGVGPDVAKQLEIFKRQLQSIEYSEKGYLPSYSEVKSAFERIAKAGPTQVIESRRAIIAEWVAKGCAIKYQDAPFRKLESKERDDAYEFLDHHIKPNFKLQNQALCRRLIEEHLTVKADAGASAKAQIEKLLTLLVHLDNKSHYNELGQILGMLISKTKTSTGQNRVYSAPQLTTWLEALLDNSTYETQHYPVNLLNEILTSHIDNKNSSLLNIDLFRLKDRTESIERLHLIQENARLDLPNPYKPILVKLSLQSQDKHDVAFIRTAQGLLMDMHRAEAHPDWMKATTTLLTYLNNLVFRDKESVTGLALSSEQNRLEREARLTDLTTQYSQLKLPASPVLETLWQKTQIEMIHIFMEKESRSTRDNLFKLTRNPYIKMILVQSQAMYAYRGDEKALIALMDKLVKWKQPELEKLAVYYASDPRPSYDMLNRLLDRPDCETTDALIHRFETVEQGLKPNGTSKRYYSVTNIDLVNIRRVIAGMKRKGEGAIQDSEAKSLVNLLYYANTYSQLEGLNALPMNQLKSTLQRELMMLRSTPSDSPEHHQASARVLACMREVLLRKTGKWVNHTQMIDLIYAGLHNNESLLHQVRTGQGKSIITIERCAYLALNGYIVDSFTAKESLSKRDHDEFAPVMDALGIPHAYITAKSPASDYQTHTAGGVGAINYATMGNFSLFHSTHAWDGNEVTSVDREKRVAFIDEGDHVMRDEKTQYNFTDNKDGDKVYNLDEWVYRIAYEFYLEKEKEFIHDESGIRISRKTHLKELCERLQQNVKYAPKGSSFFDRYIIPALDEDPDIRAVAVTERDQQLMRLLTAAHTANGLQEGVNFSVRPEQRTVSGGTIIDTRFCKVMISNQIQEGSTYSDLVQQLLHVRMNREAVTKGESPNFFVEPTSQIALSLNAPFLLKTTYGKVEGCTGTAGSQADLKVYRDEYNISHVAKLPTHEPVRTVFLPTVFCDDESQKIEKLVEQIISNPNMCILVTCKNDIAVKRIGKALAAKLKERDYSRFEQFTIDTNDSGKREADVLPLAGKNGSVTISARLGRGTDIKPDPNGMLFVLRTSPATPRIEKQERGRTGRNGAEGLCQDILNYSKIEKQFNKAWEDGNRLDQIYKSEKAHLQDKLSKHTKASSKKWSWLENDDEGQQTNYLKTRALQLYKHEMKEKSEQFSRQKESLMATLSGNVSEILRQHIHDKNSAAHEQLRKDWLKVSKNIENKWTARLAGKSGDSEEVYKQFFVQAQEEWRSLCARHSFMNPLVLLDSVKSIDELPKGREDLGSFLDKKLAYWEERKKSNKLVHADTETLKALGVFIRKNVLLKMGVHSDKDPAKAEANKVLVQKATQLNTLVKTYLLDLKDMTEAPKASAEGAVASPDSTRVDALSLYLHYVRGVETYYFNEVDPHNEQHKLMLDTVYGSEHEDLDNLFIFLQKSSMQGPIDRRTRLFNTFKDCMSYPSFFTITANQLQETITLLMNQPTEEHDEAYCQCLIRFFSQPWLAETRPYDTSPDDMKRNGDLLTVIMGMVTKCVVTENDASLKFVTNFGTAVHDNFWNTFTTEPLLSNIKNVFETNPVVIGILSQYTDADDLGHLIRLLDDHPIPIKQEELKQYIQNHQDELRNHPYALRPLLSLILGPMYNDYIPKPDCLSRLPREYQSSFWNFLTERQPINKSSCVKLIALLNRETITPEFLEKIVGPLLKIPANISIDDILKKLKFNPGQENFDQGQVSLKSIHAAGSAFKDFVESRDLTKPQHAVEFHRWKALFETLPLNQSQTLFTQIGKYQTIPTATLGLMATTLSENMQGSDLAEATAKLKLAKRCQEFESKSGFKLADHYAGLANDPAENRRTRAFLDAMDQVTLSPTEISPLCRAFFIDQTLNVDQVTEAVSIIDEAKKLQKKENYAKVFSFDATPSNRKKRERIMHHLLHGFLNLGADFSDRCNAEYQVLANKLAKQPFAKTSPNTAAKVFQQHYREVRSFTKEMSRIATPTVDIPHHYADIANVITPLTTSFEAHKSRYARSFFKNKQRKQQADALFSSIIIDLQPDQGVNELRQNYYLKTLQAIWESQKSILNSDKSTKRNRKGYSRLYNTSMQMFIEVSRQYLADENLSIEQKAPLNAILDTQFDFHLDLLVERLPNTHNLKSALHQLKIRPHANFHSEGSTEVAELRKLLTDLNPKSIPPHCRYLVDNVKCFVDLKDNQEQPLSQPRTTS